MNFVEAFAYLLLVFVRICFISALVAFIYNIFAPSGKDMCILRQCVSKLVSPQISQGY